MNKREFKKGFKFGIIDAIRNLQRNGNLEDHLHISEEDLNNLEEVILSDQEIDNLADASFLDNARDENNPLL